MSQINEGIQAASEAKQELSEEQLHDGRAPAGGPDLLHRQFEGHARAQPDAVAVSDGRAQLSYGELNDRANKLARLLIRRGAGPDMAVALAMDRSCDLIVGLLGILKAGAGYVPLDLDYPYDRLQSILRQAAPPLLVTRSDLTAGLPDHASEVICLDQAEHDEQIGSLPVEVAGSALCYVIFTSGSTGDPKGVMVTHDNIARIFHQVGEYLSFGKDDVWTMFHSVAFGFSVWEIWGALSQGGRLVIVPSVSRADPASLLSLIKQEGVTVISQTPSAFRQILLDPVFDEDLARLTLRIVALSGEAVVPADLRAWFDRHGKQSPRVVNTYAITETGGQVAFQEYFVGQVQDQDARNIGCPLSDTEVLILGDDGRPVEQGEVGEMFVGGPGVARGYINDEELTAHRFVMRDPDGSGVRRFYRTGDRARLLASGELEFLGRTDDQVKIRGYRVELGEIETALRNHPSVREATVDIREDGTGNPQLVGYIVSYAGTGNGADPAEGEMELWPSLGEYQIYDELLYQLMTTETVRNEYYRKAFDQHCRDKVVLDIGTGGDALLARMCIEAGARKAYAVEVLPEAADSARQLVDRLGLSDRIEVIQGDSASVELPEKVELCTQGIIGNIGSSDGIVPIWNDARRLFKDGCIAVPSRCVTMVAGVELPEKIRRRPVFADLSRQYVEKIFASEDRQFDVRLCARNFPETGIITDRHQFENLDFNGDMESSYSDSAVFTVSRDGIFDGFLLWTLVTTTEGETMDYLKHQQAWLPVYFPMADGGVSVRLGDRLRAEWECSTDNDDVFPDYHIQVSVESDSEPTRTFEYTTRHHETALNSTAMHRHMLQDLEQESPDLTITGLRGWLSGTLPEYMVPSAWCFLEELPLNANGKLDRSALPEPDLDRSQLGSEYVEPDSSLQIDLARIWAEVLDVEKVGVGDNFFDLGGDSIRAVRLTSATQQLLDDGVPLAALFEAPTIGQLSLWLEENHADAVARRYDDGFETEEGVI